MRASLALATALFLAAPAAYAAEPEPAQQVLDAYKGTWAVDARMHMPNAPELKLKLSMKCRAVSLGKSVLCETSGKIPGVGPFATTTLITWEAEAKKVRYVLTSSASEVRDHVCSWDAGADGKTPKLSCGPTSLSHQGKKVTERLECAWESKKLVQCTTVADVEGDGPWKLVATARKK